MHIQRWLMVVPLVILAAALSRPAMAQVSNTHPNSCDGGASSHIQCAEAVAIWQPATPATVIALWGGARESIALKSDGTVWTWGINKCNPNNFGIGPCGKLGDGTDTERHVPVQVHGPGNVGYLNSVTAIMGGEHDNYALRADGTVWAWGANFVGQLGTGNYVNTETPVQIGFPVSVTKLGGRGYHNLAVDANGTVWAWGWNRYGELGHDTTGQTCPLVLTTTTCSNVPVQVMGISNPLTVTGGGFFSLALMPDHTVKGWGQDFYGQLGDASYTDKPAPVAASGVLSHVVQISAGWRHSVALTDDGHVWTWGDNSSGEIGTGVTSAQGISVPFEVPGLTNVVGVSGGDAWTGALKADGTVWTWGWNGFGQLGDASNVDHRSAPVQVQGLDHVILFAARDYHALAAKDDGTVWAWGSGLNGELGDNMTSNSNIPVQVIFSPQVLQPSLWLPLVVR